MSGGIVIAATPGCSIINPTPVKAIAPWSAAGADYEDPRKYALSYAILCPNPHNRQPWMVDLSTEDEVALYIDPERQLPHTDPFSRQITIGLGCFLELMTLAAAAQGWAVSITPFPDGYDTSKPLDNRPVAIAKFSQDASLELDTLFQHVMERRSVKEPYDTSRTLEISTLENIAQVGRHGLAIHSSNEENSVNTLRQLTREALNLEIETPRTYKESVDLFRIGKSEVETNPDGIDFSGRFFELMGQLRFFTRESALDTSSTSFKKGKESVVSVTDTAMAHLWVVSPGNTRIDQLNAGRDWMRIHLAATREGVAMQPLSQALQEYPEMSEYYKQVHELLAPTGGTVQMLARLGYAQTVAPSPRWSLESILARGGTPA